MSDTAQPVWTNRELRRRADNLALGHVVTGAFLGRVYDAMLVMSMEAQARLAAADAAYTELAGMLAETERERDAAVYTLALRNPDALAGDIRQWVVDAMQRLKALEAELVTLRQELDRLNADLEAGQTFMVPNALTDEQRAMWQEFYGELNKQGESEDADNGE